MLKPIQKEEGVVSEEMEVEMNLGVMVGEGAAVDHNPPIFLSLIINRKVEDEIQY